MKLTLFGGIVVEGNAEELAAYTAIVCRVLKNLQDMDEQNEIEASIRDLMNKPPKGAAT